MSKNNPKEDDVSEPLAEKNEANSLQDEYDECVLHRAGTYVCSCQAIMRDVVCMRVHTTVVQKRPHSHFSFYCSR